MDCPYYYEPYFETIPVLKYQTRILSIDVLRGIVMILMALDHTRHFLYGELVDQNDGLNNLWLFFIRFITNFCAPAFLLLAGFSIYLSSQTFRKKKDQSIYLLKRGVILILLELTLMNCFWDTTMTYIEFQILWVFGLSFMIMALFIHLPKYVNLVIALLLIICQHLIKFMGTGFENSFWGAILYYPQYIEIKDVIRIQILYTIIPWTAVMMLGYGMSGVFETKPSQRRRILIWSGALVLVSFFILRSLNGYGNAHHWQPQFREKIYDIISFLNITKYPASLNFMLFSLGITFLLLAALDRVKNEQFIPIRTLGNVALFFYIIHIPIIRAITKAYYYFFPQVPGPIVFILLWISIVLFLWWICTYYRQFKFVHKNDMKFLWLKYV